MLRQAGENANRIGSTIVTVDFQCKSDQPEVALRYLMAQPDSALFCVARQRGNWPQPQNGPKLPVRFSM
jgi:hypothetical protein